ncbi:bifunctional DNA primase/polymerase [Pseudofrankia sp. BMG5.37]|uniref:bifunctional DNA primase/polymerase n=1 Tax=Pseudofrankia sp. BMG5.37 TaxID=3050035 RepID=UPI002895382B|nr:bifunctional DNA primase/polymerase [Pseudofrankia sp. BMG5.37]MDT3438359.1 bifunctional DNA primase/polymerase [Pseudofrankia sp. BMG5.37]
MTGGLSARGAAALDYAAHGWPVLPLRWIQDGRCSCDHGAGCYADSPGKHPIREAAPRGLTDATNAPDVVGAWWSRWPLANIGLRTGVVADVLDADGPDGHAGLAALVDEGRMPPVTWRIAETGRAGGLHLYLPPTGDGNHTGGKSGWPPHLDYRGRGGYVLAPPSNHLSGRIYQWRDGLALPELDTATGRPEIAARMPWEPAAPVVARPVNPPRRTSLPPTGTTTDGTPYGRAALADEAATLRSTSPGARNVQLFESALKLGRHVAAGNLSEDAVRRELAAAVDSFGDWSSGSRSFEGTYESGLRKGMTDPRPAPERPFDPPAADVDELARFVRAGGPPEKVGGRLVSAVRRLGDRDSDVKALIGVAAQAGMPVRDAVGAAVYAIRNPRAARVH